MQKIFKDKPEVLKDFEEANYDFGALNDLLSLSDEELIEIGFKNKLQIIGFRSFGHKLR
jgi:hypothetical protein